MTCSCIYKNLSHEVFFINCWLMKHHLNNYIQLGGLNEVPMSAGAVWSRAVQCNHGLFTVANDIVSVIRHSEGITWQRWTDKFLLSFPSLLRSSQGLTFTNGNLVSSLHHPPPQSFTDNSKHTYIHFCPSLQKEQEVDSLLQVYVKTDVFFLTFPLYKWPFTLG